MLDPSDLSHLTPAEQNQILEVIRRQQDEEEKEKKMIQSLCDDFENYKSCIRINTERRPTNENNTGDDDPVCSLCSKTKFAEGSGYLCSLCNTRFCSRCGGKITVRSNKTVWVCNVCRKQKEILAKSGAWFYGNGQIQWDSKSFSGSEKENVANDIGDHNTDTSRKSSNSSWEPSENVARDLKSVKYLRKVTEAPETRLPDPITTHTINLLSNHQVLLFLEIHIGIIESKAEPQPSFWQPSADGMFLIGRLTLNKYTDDGLSESMLGLKVVGGKRTHEGRYAAFITRIKRGSLADTVGHLKPGDEIISWNNHCLQGLDFNEVYEIIAESRRDPTVDLMVSRPIRDTPRISGLQPSPSSTCSVESNVSSSASLGRLHIKIWHDEADRILYVTALSATDLPLRGRGVPRNPYLKMYLLPDRSSESKRKTKVAKKTLNPEWRQTFQYQFVETEEIETKALELSLWDWDQSLDGNNYFIGEVIVDLGLLCLDDEPHSFSLRPLGHGLDQDYPALTDQSTSTTQLASNDICDSSTNGVRDNLSSRSSKSATKRRLPPLPNEADRAMREDTADRSSQNASESDFNEGPRGLANGQHEKTGENSDTTTIYDTLQAFVGGTGPGQIVGRQTLGVSPVGEIEVGFKMERGKFLVRIIQAFDLSCRPTAKSIPGFYVKVCMMDDMRRVAKQKTGTALKSLSPRFQQTLCFEPQQKGNIVQVMVVAVYSRMESKMAAGVAEISLQKLNLRTKMIGRYKLFPTSQLDSRQWTRHHSVSSSFGSNSLVQ